MVERSSRHILVSLAALGHQVEDFSWSWFGLGLGLGFGLGFGLGLAALGQQVPSIFLCHGR